MESNTQESVNDQKIKVIAARYALYLQQKNKVQINNTCEQLKQISNLSQRIWNILMPIFVRGPISDYEQLLQIYGKKLPLKLSKQSIENTLIKGSQTALGLVYNSTNLTDIFTKMNGQFWVEFAKKYDICPINAEGQKFLCEYAPKLNKRQIHCPCLIVFWKGLFDELIVLKIVPLTISDIQILLQIEQCIEERKSYEAKIKKQQSQMQTASSINCNSSSKINFNTPNMFRKQSTL